MALKIFRDAATVSDGDPAHEIDVGFALTHANVIRVLGASPAPKLGHELADGRQRRQFRL